MSPNLAYAWVVSMANRTFTIGYSGRSVNEFLGILKKAGVERVVDVRALPLSRKKGFSKNLLCSALAEQGIEYIHLRAAGNPFREMKNDIAKCLKLYGEYLDAHPKIVNEVECAVRNQNTALLCFEADACACHRSVIAQRLSRNRRAPTMHHL